MSKHRRPGCGLSRLALSAGASLFAVSALVSAALFGAAQTPAGYEQSTVEIPQPTPDPSTATVRVPTTVTVVSTSRLPGQIRTETEAVTRTETATETVTSVETVTAVAHPITSTVTRTVTVTIPGWP